MEEEKENNLLVKKITNWFLIALILLGVSFNIYFLFNWSKGALANLFWFGLPSVLYPVVMYLIVKFFYSSKIEKLLIKVAVVIAVVGLVLLFKGFKLGDYGGAGAFLISLPILLLSGSLVFLGIIIFLIRKFITLFVKKKNNY